jgi:hypothetical protein
MFYSTEKELVEDELEFDKFMDNIVKSESNKKNRQEKAAEAEEETPARRYNKLYREHWMNKTIVKGE